MSQEVSIWKVAGKKRNKFDSPEELWNKSLSYFEWCDCNPLYIVEQMKSPDKQTISIDGHTIVPPEKLIEIPRKRPYTKNGLAVFLGVTYHFFRHIKEEGYDIVENEPWMDVLDKVEQIIHNQQYEGAAVGQFNPMVISRGIGLTEKTEVETTIKEVKQVFRIGDQEFAL